MASAKGKTLRLDRIIADRGAFSDAITIEMGIRIADALHAAWKADDDGGGPERELSPFTVFVDPDGTVSAKDIGLSDMGGATVGDPGAVYRAPEGLEGHGGTTRADVFVLGSLIYEMATGQPLFTGRRAASGDALTMGLALRLANAGIPGDFDARVPGLGKVLERCLKLDKFQRWPDPRTVGKALSRVRVASKLPEPDMALFLAAAAPGAASTPGSTAPTPPGPEAMKPGGSDWFRDTAAAAAAPVDDTPTGFGDNPFNAAADAFRLDDELVDDSVESERTSPWAMDEDAEAEVVARLTKPRLTPVKGAASGVEKETFGQAVRWFIKRSILALFLVALFLFAVAWFGVFPGGTERLVARGWNALPAGVTGVVPDGWVDGTQRRWATRKYQDKGQKLGLWMLDRMPENWADTLAEEPPTPPPTAGTPTTDGIVASVEGWIDLVEDLPGGFGRLKLQVDQGGRSRGEQVRVIATSVGDGEPKGGEGTAAEPLHLQEGDFDIELIYSESGATGEHRGWLRGVHVAPGHQTTWLVGLAAPVGFLLGDFSVDSEDVASSVELAAWPESEEDENPTEPPLAEGSATELLGVRSGRYRVRATLTEEGRAPSFSWFRDVGVDVGGATTLRRADLRRGELLDPAGSGVRIAATNLGRDVSEQTTVFVFAAGAGASSIALAQGPAAYYFDVPAGRYDIRLVYEPNVDAPQFRATRTLEKVRLAPDQVLRQTVDMGMDVAWLRLRAKSGEESVTSGLRVTVIKAGADFEGATRVADEDGGGPHPVPPGEYDVYLQLKIDGTRRLAAFPGVKLGAGDTWSQRLTTDDTVWE